MSVNRKKAAIISAVIIAICVILFATMTHRKPLAMAGGVEYNIPPGHFYSSSDDSILLFMSYPDGKSLINLSGGWEKHIIVLITPEISSISSVYDSLYDGTPKLNPGKMFTIKSIIKDKGLIIQTMEDGNQIILSDSSDTIDWFMRCGEKSIDFPAPACELYFTKNNQRWKVTFGKQFLYNYQKIQKNVIEQMNKYEVK